MNNPLKGLTDQLTKLPGVGEKSAQRMAFFLMSLSEHEVSMFTQVISHTKTHLRYCEQCFNISFEVICSVCQDSARQLDKLCVVSDPKDIVSIEKSGSFNGKYHVLGGLISPLDGIHPDMLRIPELLSRLKDGVVTELIFAINSTVQGDTTLLYLKDMLKDVPIQLSKLAYGLPMGADIEYTDEMTLNQAIQGRVSLV